MSIKLGGNVEIIPIEQMWSSIWEISKAQLLGDTLAKVYPGYQWLVRAHANRGYFVIQCAEINASLATTQPWGMLLHVNKMDDAGLLKKKIVRMGGELLERAGLVRGRSTGDRPKQVDGVPQHQQPLRW